MKILLGADGSDAAGRAATFVVEHLAAEKPEVVVVAVLPYSLFPYGGDTPDPDREQTAQEALARATSSAVRILESAGAKVDVVRKFGYPSDELDEEIEYWAPDLVVMGRRGLHGPARWLGSVSEHVLHRSKVPVLLVA